MESRAASAGDRPGVARGAVQHEDDVAATHWDDPERGRIGFRTLLGGDGPTGAFTAGVAELEPGGWLARHRHAPPELYHVLEGEGVVTVDGTEHPVRAGTLVHIPGDAEHGVRNTGTDRLRFFYTLAAPAFDEVEYHFSGSDEHR